MAGLLQDKVVVISGVGPALGTTLARRCAEEGADLILAARTVERLEDVAGQVTALGRRALAVGTDITDDAQVANLVAVSMAEFGKVDVLINNAGVGTAHPATRETPDEFRSVIDVNLNGSYWMAQACGRVMKPGSSIINIASVLGITTAGLPQAAYSSSKAAIIGLTRDLAQQWGSRKGIRVNALAPGFFKTEMTDEYPPEYLDSQAHRLVLGRLGDDRELSATAVWLASAAGGYVTGQTIVVDGGLTIT